MADTDHNLITLPIDALVVLIGPAGSGKSSFAAEHFPSTRVVSSDTCRAMISDDPANQDVSREAFHLMMTVINHRLRLGRLTVADSTALNSSIREEFRSRAETHDRPVVALLFDASAETCKERNHKRQRQVPETVIDRHVRTFRDQKNQIEKEPFDRVYTIGETELEQTRIRYQNTNVRLDVEGPFDVIGDLHGCLNELKRLLDQLGYERDASGFYHPDDRTAVFIGDLTDRGPDSVGCLALALDMVENDRALYIPGNHCKYLYRYLQGDRDSTDYGLQSTLDELDELDDERADRLQQRFLRMYETAPPYLILDDGNLVVSHAGLREKDIGEVSDRVVDFCLYGDTTGETLPDGYPVRKDWPLAYRGDPLVVYGHTPAAKPTKVNNTINIDQGAVYGGYLTAYRYPENETTNVKSPEAYHPEEPEDVQNLQYRRAEKVFRTELLRRSFDVDTPSGRSIDVSQNVIKRGLDRISRAELSLNQLLYLPSEPARAMPSSQHGSSFQSCCEEMVDHFRDEDLEQVRVFREDPGMSPAVLACFRNQEASNRFFGTDRTVHLWTPRGQRIPLSERKRTLLREQVFDQPWLIERDTCVITEGLWRDPSTGTDDPLRKWVHRDRFELKEVVSRLRDAESRVGAVQTVLDDLEEIHSDIGRLAEKAFGDEDAFTPVEDQNEPETTSPGGPGSEETTFFLPMRLIASNQRVLLGTVRDLPAGRPLWGLDPSRDPNRDLVTSMELEETTRHLNQLWTDRPTVRAWWVLPTFPGERPWNGNVVPAFHLVGRQTWNFSKLISPRRWWGQEVKAHWAGWNSSKDIFALGRESARRFVGSLPPGYIVQTVAAQAGLAHW